ncbi:MAG: peptidase M61 [Isosphaera sp.]|nr:peptidase M61 [Isosphaera sp.]
MSRAAVLVLLLAAAPARAADPPVEVEVDLSGVARRKVRATLTVPATPGPLTLHYPKWIPGTHGPIGPVSEQAGFRVAAGGSPLTWRRDDIDTHAYHVTVPEGAKGVEVTFDLLLQPPGTGSWLGATLTAASPKLAILNWNEVLVYPGGKGVLARPFRATVKLPAGWKHGTALTAEKADGDRVTFTAVPLEELIDSPLLAGEHLKEVPIGPKHRVVLAYDDPAKLDIPADTKAAWERLVTEAGLLFGTRHYRSYTFLLSLSDQVPNFGLEHHESSDNRLPENGLTDATVKLGWAGLLPHEFAHSWNGKFRRPADMVVPDYGQAQKTRLLWVYEGLTNYLGEVLAARSGLLTADQARDVIGVAADRMTQSRGRAWRPLDDTAAANFVLLPAPPGWTSYRRSLDYYDEGTLLWLEADVLIRKKTDGKKSLDDFCRVFYGGDGGKPRVSGYTLDDLVAALNGVAAHDWKGHFARRVSVPTETPPLDGITEGGWKLTYGDKPTPVFEAQESYAKGLNLAPSVGLLLGADGKVTDVVPDGPAAKAGLAPGMKVVAVNGRKYSDAGVKAAVAATKTGGKLELLTETGEFYKTHAVGYAGGARYPRLERGDGPDRLADILKPLAPPAAGGGK